MNIPGRLLVVCAVAVTLAACVSTETRPSKVSDKDAARYNLQLGATYLQRGELQLAQEKLEKSVEQDPDLAAARSTLALLYERLGEARKAEEQYRAALRLAPKDPAILNNYGSYLCRGDRRRDGITYFLRAAENPLYRTPEAALTNAGVCARPVPDPAGAERYLRAALERNPRYRPALLQLADLNLAQGRAMKARAFLERYHGAGDATAGSLVLGIRIEEALGEATAAAAYRRRLLTDYPDSAAALEEGGDATDDER